ncbi:MAG: DUF308 domain-containing protein [Spirosoma sp.]|nr:DUF308 domain-containing protein [Spirosoma sp.]
MSRTTLYVFTALFGVLGVLRLVGAVNQYSQDQTVNWWKLLIGIIFIVSAVMNYRRARNMPKP